MTGNDMHCSIAVQKEEATVVISLPENMETQSPFSLKYSDSSDNAGMELLLIVTIPTKTNDIDIYILFNDFNFNFTGS